MTPSSKPFAYDQVLSLDSSHRVRHCLSVLEAAPGGRRRLLAVTLNHRFYNLHEKNSIKGTIETHGLDHLMFSIRPSSQRLIEACEGSFIEKFKDLSQLAFVLQAMGRYEIAQGLVDDRHLSVVGEESISVREIESEVASFLDELTSRFSAVPNIRKQFAWLYSVTDVLPALRDRRLSLFSGFGGSSATVHEYDDHQIAPPEENLFWIGFDPSYQQVPVDKPYPTTKWTESRSRSAAGKGLYEAEIKYCTRCCLPETMEGISFDEIGICVPCRSSEEKMHINWEERGKALTGIIDSFRS
jgi:hypothetical protein